MFNESFVVDPLYSERLFDVTVKMKQSELYAKLRGEKAAEEGVKESNGTSSFSVEDMKDYSSVMQAFFM